MTIEDEIVALTTATTALLTAVNVGKAALDASVSTATTKAGEAAGSAGTASTKAAEAADSATDAADSAARAAASAASLSGTVTGTNTGDETEATIKTKLGISVLSGANTGDQTIPTTLPASDVYAWAKEAVKPAYTKAEVGLGNVPDLAFSGLNTGDQDLSGKQDILVSGTTIKTVGGVSLLGSGNVPVREQLTAARIYYVRTDGSNSNTGLENTSGGAFLTLQKAVDTAASIDLGTFSVTINVAAGTYAGVTLKNYVSGGGTVSIIGDQVTPSNVFINGGATDAVVGNAFSNRWIVRGFKLAGAHCLYSNGVGSTIIASNIEFYTATSYSIRASAGGYIRATGTLTVTASTPVFAYSTGGSLVQIVGPLVLVGTPDFSWRFIYANELASVAVQGTITGAATGQRYAADSNSVINVYGAGTTYLPGDVAGQLETGGQYL